MYLVHVFKCKSTLREFPSLEAMQRHIPGGCFFFAVYKLNGHSSCTNKIEMPVSEGYEMSDKFESFNVNHKSPHETKLGSNVGDERKNVIFSAQLQTNARQKTRLELGQGYSGAPLPNKVTTTSTKNHFMNSVFVQPGIYSCATDCQRDLISF